MALRAQISLLFSDENLYKNLIIPYKEQKVLSELIIKCLSAYYYNEETRRQIEGVCLDDIIEDGATVESSQDICNSIRNSLAMQSFLATELQQTLETATGDMEDILHNVNKVAEDVGIVKPTKSEYGIGVPQISMENMILGGSNVIRTETSKPSESNTSYDLVIKVLKHILERDGDAEGMAILDGRLENTSGANTNTFNEISSQSLSDDVASAEIEEEEVSVNTEVITNNTFEDTVIKEEEITVVEDEDNDMEEQVSGEDDALSDMMALLSGI